MLLIPVGCSALVPPFEATEKKLFIAIDPSAGSLRARGEAYWHNVVAQAQAKIVGKMESLLCDAYVLSESSLFVFDTHLLMITCGRSRLIDAAMLLLEDLPRETIKAFSFERRRAAFPELQASSFEDDALRIKNFIAGQTIVLGSAEDPFLSSFIADSAGVSLPVVNRASLFMQGISSEIANLFSGSNDAAVLRHTIQQTCSDMKIDEHFFAPVGYSCNGLSDEQYLAVHVTPQTGSSYASLEFGGRQTPELSPAFFDAIVSLFQPQADYVVVNGCFLSPVRHMERELRRLSGRGGAPVWCA